MATTKAALCASPPAAWCQTLCLRHTFIHVLEDSTPDVSPRRRARSEPGLDWMPSAAFFQEDADYVDALQAKMEDPISALNLPLPPPAHFLKDVAISTMDLTVRVEQDLNKNIAAHGTCFPSSPFGGVSKSFAHSTLAPTVLVEQEDLNEAAPPVFKASVTSDASTSAMLLRDTGEEVAPPPESWRSPCTPACNPGSAGHPMLCNRPCRFFLEGLCKSSADCGFCHLPHPKSGSSLDKRNRVLLKSMSSKNRCGLLAAAMKSRVHPFTEMTKLVDDWAWEVGGASAATEVEEAVDQAVEPGIKRPGLRRLLACLQTMSLANLCSLARLHLDAGRDINEGGHLFEALRRVLV